MPQSTALDPRPPARRATTTAEARRDIEQRRGEISTTLDDIERLLAAKKANLVRKLDVTRPARDYVRRRPWRTAALIAGTFAILRRRRRRDR